MKKRNKPMARPRLHFFFMNIGHFYDHLFMLVFATVAALALSRDWGMSYAELIPYATPGFLAFGLLALPAGWIADKWSREGMMAVFFIGLGLSSILTALAQTPLQIGTVVAINGIYGNLGVASAALITGFLIDQSSWRAAFVAPGIICLGTGLLYLLLFRHTLAADHRSQAQAARRNDTGHLRLDRSTIIRVFAILIVATSISGVVFQSATFALPKVLDEKLAGLDLSATLVGWYTFLVFALAAVAQLIVGSLLDRLSERTVFMTIAALQAGFFALMPGLTGFAALAVAIAFMLAVFGQIPINDVLIGRITKSEWRARVYGARYVITFSGVALAIPMLAWIHAQWGFDTLFRVLAGLAMAILVAASLLPGQLRPAAQPMAAE